MEGSLKKLKLTNELKQGKISNEKWNGELSKIKINRDDMNKLVLNYLIIEGYKEAVIKFTKESNLTCEYDLSFNYQITYLNSFFEKFKIIFTS